MPANGHLKIVSVFAALALWLAGALGVQTSSRAAEPQKLVIVLSSYEPGVPEVATLVKGIREGLVGARPTQFSIFVEHLDTSTAAGADTATLRKLLTEKYGERDPDLIITLGSDALDFATGLRKRIWKGTPIVFTGEPRIALQPTLAPNMSGVIAAVDTDRTLDSTLQLFPKTKRIALICGASRNEARLKAEFLRDFQYYKDRLELIDLSGQSLEAVKERLDTLGEDAVAYFLSFRTDGTNRSFLASEVLDVLSPSAKRPIFGTSETYFGHGIIGGWLIDYGQLGREVSVLAARVLGGEPASYVPVERSASIRPMFDWRNMQRWGLSEEQLPAGSIVLFKEQTLWERYKAWIMTAIAAILLQASLIGLLLWERGRRRTAEAKALRLSGEIIKATEDERGRIARELHDDVSQRLALLSIELAQLDMQRAEPARTAAGAGAAARVAPRAALGEAASLSAKAQEIAGDIYRIARELQPGALKHLGLVAATRSFCSELASLHALNISVSGESDLPELPEATATTLYRVVQESLQNVVKHARATEASVSFARGADHVAVTISDNGRGFDPGAATPGTGIMGMRERLRLLDGTLEVHARAGVGTAIHVRLPWRSA